MQYNIIKEQDIETQINTILSASEDDKLSLLRDDEFISNVDSNLLEILLNNISFNYVFSLLQNKNILSKINKIDVKFVPRDSNLFIDYLQQDDIVDKTSSTMLKNMLINLKKDDVLNYLNKDNILKNLTNKDIIEIASTKNIDLINDFKYMDKLIDDEIITYINNSFKSGINYNLVNNEYVLKLFPQNINMDEVIYLYDLLTTKTNHKIEDITHSFYSFKAVVNLYYLHGLNDCIKLCEENISLNKITQVYKDIDINKIVNNKDALEFLNKNYLNFLKYSYPLSLSFGNIINNYNKEYNKFDNIFDLEKYLIDHNISNSDNVSKVDFTVDNNIAYIYDNKDYEIDFLNTIANNLLNNEINYVIAETKRDIKGIRLSSNKILIANNKNLSEFILNQKEKAK